MSDQATVEPPESFEALKGRLIEIEPNLPKRLRQAAAYALEHPDEFALGTASAHRPQRRGAGLDSGALRPDARLRRLLRSAGGVPLPPAQSLARLFRAAQGLARDRPRQRRSDQPADRASPTRPRPRSPGCAKRSHRRELDRAIDLLARAKTIYCLGQRRSFSVAHYLTYALAQLGLSALLIDNVGGLGPEQLARAGPEDALIAISFSPYSPFTVDLARRARRADTPIVVVTDSALSPLAGLADVRFEIVESDFGSFRSLAATFCLAMTLAVAVAEQRTAGQ